MSIKVFLVAFILVFVQFTTSFAQTENMRVVAKLRDLAPDGSVIATLNQPSINNKGEVTFLTTNVSLPRLLVTRDIFNNPKTEILVKRGDPIVGLDGAAIFRMTFPKSNDNGDIVFSGSISNLPIDGGIFVLSQGQIKPIALTGAPTPIGGVFTGDLSLTSLFNINNKGEVVFLSNRATSDILAGIFLFKNGIVNKVIANGDMVQGVGTIMFNGSTAPVINEQGDILFSATTQEMPMVSNIYLFSNGIIKKVVSGGDPAPQGGVFEQVSSPGRYLNNKGEILFLGKVSEKNGIYLFSSETNKITKIVVDGDPAPDGGVFKDLGISLTPSHGRLTNNSSFVFRGSTSKTIYGLFYFSNGRISKVVAQREPTPLGGVFAEDAIFNAAFLGSIISDKDEVVFEALIKGGSVTKALIAWSPNIGSPKITSASYDNKAKLLQVKSSNIGTDTKVEINGKLVSQPIKVISDVELSVKGNRKKLNLNKEANTNKVVLVFSSGVRSETFTF